MPYSEARLKFGKLVQQAEEQLKVLHLCVKTFRTKVDTVHGNCTELVTVAAMDAARTKRVATCTGQNYGRFFGKLDLRYTSQRMH